MAVSIAMLGSVQLPERNSCVYGPGAAPVVVGAPNAAFSQKPELLPKIGDFAGRLSHLLGILEIDLHAEEVGAGGVLARLKGGAPGEVTDRS